MKTLALCAQSFHQSVRIAAGVEPVCFPPHDTTTFNPSILSGYRFIYLKFHGLPDQPFLYTDNLITAISAHQLAAADLRHATIFAAVCYLPQTPLFQVLLTSGARAVIAGDGTNYGHSSSLVGADLLGYYIRLALTAGLAPEVALIAARLLFRLHRPRSISDEIVHKDTLKFRCVSQVRPYLVGSSLGPVGLPVPDTAGPNLNAKPVQLPAALGRQVLVDRVSHGPNRAAGDAGPARAAGAGDRRPAEEEQGSSSAAERPSDLLHPDWSILAAYARTHPAANAGSAAAAAANAAAAPEAARPLPNSRRAYPGVRRGTFRTQLFSSESLGDPNLFDASIIQDPANNGPKSNEQSHPFNSSQQKECS